MKKPERSTYTSIDFRDWHENATLVISPKFQRRGVWTRAARSSLIDTILIGLPVPPIYIRMTQNSRKSGVVREIVDGQQRLSAILDFLQDGYALTKNIESLDCIGKYFSQLTGAQKSEIEQYSFICEVMYGVSDADVLRIFARLNTFSVKLNAQELRNGKYFGRFKVSAYDLALEHLEFWRRNRIFTERGIARMQEAELTSELMIASIEGIQDKKISIDAFYEMYDDEFHERRKVEERFRHVVDVCNSLFDDGLGTTEFRRVPLFYSLYCAIYHLLFGMTGMTSPSPERGRIRRSDVQALRDAVQSLSDVLEQAKTVNETPRRFVDFVNACLRQTDNLRPRVTRANTIFNAAFA